MAGRLAQDFDLLPWSLDLEGAIQWSWDRFTRSSDAEALAPDEQAVANIRAWIAERWDVTIKSVDTGADGFDRKLNNREAVAWYDEIAIYLPVQRLREASGETLKAQQIVKALTDGDLLAKRHDGKRAVGAVGAAGRTHRRLCAQAPGVRPASRLLSRTEEGSPARDGRMTDERYCGILMTAPAVARVAPVATPEARNPNIVASVANPDRAVAPAKCLTGQPTGQLATVATREGRVMGIPFPQFEEGSRVVSYVLRWLEWPEWLLAFGSKT